MELDRLDARIIAALQEDGRKSIVDLAAEVGLSHTPCARRVRQLEQAGIIQGYAALVDPVGLGLRVRAFVQVKLERHTDENVENFRRALETLEEVVSCYATTGAYDFMLQVVAPDLEALSTVVLKRVVRIAGVRDVHSSIALDTVKRSVRLPLGHLP